MKTIMIWNRKGGTGKSTITCNLAGCLYKNFNKKILVLDCDVQKNSTEYLLSQGNNNYTVFHVLKGKAETEEALVNVKIPDYSAKDIVWKDTNIDMLPGDSDIDLIKDVDFSIFQKMFKTLDKDYDYCLIDCPPALTGVTEALLRAAQYVIVPSDTSVDGLSGYGNLLNTVIKIRREGNPNLKILGIVFNNVDFRDSHDKDMVESNREILGEQIFDTSIIHSTTIKQARDAVIPITYYTSYKQSAKVIKDYISLGNEILEKTGEK